MAPGTWAGAPANVDTNALTILELHLASLWFRLFVCSRRQVPEPLAIPPARDQLGAVVQEPRL